MVELSNYELKNRGLVDYHQPLFRNWLIANWARLPDDYQHIPYWYRYGDRLHQSFHIMLDFPPADRAHGVSFEQWRPPPPDVIQVTTDGACRRATRTAEGAITEGAASCGALMRNSFGVILGYCLGGLPYLPSPFLQELCGAKHGFILAKKGGVIRLELVSDNQQVIDLLRDNDAVITTPRYEVEANSPNARRRNELRFRIFEAKSRELCEIRVLISYFRQCGRSVIFNHQLREQNFSADNLTRFTQNPYVMMYRLRDRLSVGQKWIVPLCMEHLALRELNDGEEQFMRFDPRVFPEFVWADDGIIDFDA